jgi:PAS domain S-box-containing protein
MQTLHPDILASAESLIAEHPDGTVSVATSKGIYVYVSPGHQRVLGYLPEDLIGESHQKVSVFPSNYNGIRLVDIALTSDLVHMAYTARTKSGKLIPMETHARTIADPETGELFILAWSDVVE